MAELRDPDRPPGAVVEVDEKTCEGIRNDGRRPKPAEQNPWYVLATIAGVQEGTFSDLEIDKELAAQNRRYWNGWACADMTEEERAAMAEKMDVPVVELAPLTEAERHKVELEFADRLGSDVPLPAPSESIEFRETHFPHTCAWQYYVFPTVAFFVSSTFSGTSHFHSATFGGAAQFDSATFCGTAVFYSANFSGDAVFRDAMCSGFADFWSAAFSSLANFQSATFSEYASFESATFSGDADFVLASFSLGASYWGAAFSGYANFGSAAFDRSAGFGFATFSKGARFSSATFRGYPKLIGTLFRDAANFDDATFDKPTSFRGAAFEAAFPDLTGAVLHEDTDFSVEDWAEVRGKGGKVRRPVWAERPEDPAAARKSAAKIRHVLSQQGRVEDAHFFFRREMAFNGRIGGWARRLPYWLFRWVSDYGSSIERPVLGLVLTVVVPWALVPWGCALTSGSLLGLGREFALSMANTFSFFGFQRLYFDVEVLQAREGWMQVLGGVQTVLGFVFVFFLGLGLRNRFRLK